MLLVSFTVMTPIFTDASFGCHRGYFPKSVNIFSGVSHIHKTERPTGEKILLSDSRHNCYDEGRRLHNSSQNSRWERSMDRLAGSFLVMTRRNACLLLEEGAEGGCIGKMEKVGNLFDTLVGIVDIKDGLLDDGLKHELLNSESR